MSNLPKKAEDKINTLGIASIGVVSTLLVWASVVALQAYYNSTNETLEQERAVEGQSTQARVVRAEQEGQLNPETIETVDPKKGTVRVPIEFAMNEVVNVLSKDPGASAVPGVTEAHNVPTVPAVWGRPPDNATVDSVEPDVDADGDADEGPPEPSPGAAPAPGGATPPANPAPANPPPTGGKPPQPGGGNSPQPNRPAGGGATQ